MKDANGMNHDEKNGQFTSNEGVLAKKVVDRIKNDRKIRDAVSKALHPKPTTKHFELPKKEYANFDSAIRTRYANKTPKRGSINSANTYYLFRHNKAKEKNVCVFKIDIEGNEEYIKLLEDEYGIE